MQCSLTYKPNWKQVSTFIHTYTFLFHCTSAHGKLLKDEIKINASTESKNWWNLTTSLNPPCFNDEVQDQSYRRWRKVPPLSIANLIWAFHGASHSCPLNVWSGSLDRPPVSTEGKWRGLVSMATAKYPCL